MEKRILDWEKYEETARQMAAEGNVLLRNDGVLPLKKGTKVSLFGRIQFHYYKSGTGSGGMVNVNYVTGIYEALCDCEEISLNEELVDIYKKWDMEHPFDKGVGWGNEPWSQLEMEVTRELAEDAAKKSDAAIVVIGRTAGEDQDNLDKPGAYRLSEIEEQMLSEVRRAFDKVVVVLNVGNIIDMSWEDKYHPEAVLYAWQGGMTGGLGTVDILTGKAGPSGKLTDTIAYELHDYPSDKNFGGEERNIYQEDIYVGYRYFEMAAKERVRYPFGFGLSYTEFALRTEAIDIMLPEEEGSVSKENLISIMAEDVPAVDSWKEGELPKIFCEILVKNTGDREGKEVVQVYLNPPQGVLGKATRNLCGFAKTRCLAPGESEILTIEIPFYAFASYDETGKTGFASSYVLEEGEYSIYVGTDVRSAKKAGAFSLEKTTQVKQLSQALAPVHAFERMKAVQNGDGFLMTYEKVPLRKISQKEKREKNLPSEIPFRINKGYSLRDVEKGKASMDQLVNQFRDEVLECIIRGEGMGSPKVTPGTAAAFGGVSSAIKTYGIPCACCTDGPSGMRFDSGAKAFSLPNGTLLGCSFNEALVEELFSFTGLEMCANKVDVILGPGINIHRHPLNGRNFEYFSEDPFLTGKIASAQIRGIKTAGVTATVKHFCANEQETHRHEIDSVVSERALREIYLKPFEMTVAEAGADSVMTSYGAVNGTWTAGCYDLNTVILREEWGFEGIVMTDWWAHVSGEDSEPSKTDFASMVRAQNDIYMVCADGASNKHGDNTMEEVEAGRLTRGELRRSAANICRFLMTLPAYRRLHGEEPEVEIINRPETEEEKDETIEYHEIDKHLTINLEDLECKAGITYSFALEVKHQAAYTVELTASSMLGELAQIPVSFIFQGVPMGVFTFNGTDGKWVTQTKKLIMTNQYEVFRLAFGQNGLHLKSISFHYEKELDEVEDMTEYMQC